MTKSPTLDQLLLLSDAEKAKRFVAMVRATFSHVDGRDLLDELHPRNMLDIKRRMDAVDTWFEGDWLSTLRDERNGGHGWWLNGAAPAPADRPIPICDERASASQIVAGA